MSSGNDQLENIPDVSRSSIRVNDSRSTRAIKAIWRKGLNLVREQVEEQHSKSGDFVAKEEYHTAILSIEMLDKEAKNSERLPQLEQSDIDKLTSAPGTYLAKAEGASNVWRAVKLLMLDMNGIASVDYVYSLHNLRSAS